MQSSHKSIFAIMTVLLAFQPDYVMVSLAATGKLVLDTFT
jgi:hypothetical protein